MTTTGLEQFTVIHLLQTETRTIAMSTGRHMNQQQQIQVSRREDPS